MFLVFSLTILEPITTEGTPKLLTSFASCTISKCIIVDQPLPTEQQPRPLSLVAYSDSESDHDFVSQRPATPVAHFNDSDTGLMLSLPDIIFGKPNIFSDFDTGQVLSSPDILIGRPNIFSDCDSDTGQVLSSPDTYWQTKPFQ